MSNSVDSVKRAAAGVTRKHSRLTIFAASAATAGVLGAAGLAVGSAPWSAAAGDASKTIQGGSQSASTTAFDAVTGAKVQLDAEHSTAASSSALHRAAHQAAQPAVKETAKRTPAAKHAPAKPAPKHAPAKPAAKYAPAKHAEKPRPHPKPKGEHTRPYAIYDSVTPSSIPHGKASAVYLNGAYKASARQMAHHKHVLWIDTNGSNPGADVLDVEPGDATPAGAAVWVGHRLHKHPNSVAIVYTMRSQWQAVKNHVSHLPQWMQHKVRYWIADPTGVEHDVRGADATQWYWGKHIDISKAHPSLTK